MVWYSLRGAHAASPNSNTNSWPLGIDFLSPYNTLLHKNKATVKLQYLHKMSGGKSHLYSENTTVSREKIILHFYGKKLLLYQADSYSALVLTTYQPQGRGESIWISTSGSTHLRLQEIVFLSV